MIDVTTQAPAGVTQAVMFTGAGGFVMLLIVAFLRKASREINAAVTDHTSQSAIRTQVESLREEIGRLEQLVRSQSDKVDKLNEEILKLRLAFVDEQSALLGILAEFNANGDATTKARIAAEIEAASRRRSAVLSGDTN